MPLYNYECGRHGAFREWRAMSEAEASAPCPTCGRIGERAVSAPRLGIDAGRRKAHAINEKSASEPRIVRKLRGDPVPVHDAHRDLTTAREHASGDHHHHHHPEKHEDGKLTLRSAHPWAVRH
jgi:putative FmdB family regulatory protein